MRPLPIFYSKEARRDIHSVFDYIRLFRPSAAEEFLVRLNHVVQQIAAYPKSGSLPRHSRLKNKGYRYAAIDEYVLFYKPSLDEVTILRLVHGRRHYVPMLLS